jgi:anti-sigma factor RsiW
MRSTRRIAAARLMFRAAKSPNWRRGCWAGRNAPSPSDLPAAAYHLIGGRLLATERGGAAALLIEDDGGHRFSVLLRSMVPDPNASMTTTG